MKSCRKLWIQIECMLPVFSQLNIFEKYTTLKVIKTRLKVKLKQHLLDVKTNIIHQIKLQQNITVLLIKLLQNTNCLVLITAKKYEK